MKSTSLTPNAKHFKGIVLAAGSGSRLYPITLATSKPLLPIYDKPMIYYPLSVLMMAGIRDILIISSSVDLSRYELLLGDGSQLGICISYAVQPNPEGIAQALLIGEDYVKDDYVCLILGDNVLYGHGLLEILSKAVTLGQGGLIFGCRVKDPERYGVVEFNTANKVLRIEEKPQKPKSDYAVTGLYFFDNDVFEIAHGVKPSVRGEYEIADVLNAYQKRNDLRVELFGPGITWLDMGTYDSFMEASGLIKTMEKQQGYKVACIEEIAFRMGFINKQQVKRLAAPFLDNNYGQYLLQIAGKE